MIIDKMKFDFLRAEQCLRIKDVLRNAECSKFVVQKINLGQNLDPFTVGKIARALNVSAAEIVVKKGG